MRTIVVVHKIKQLVQIGVFFISSLYGELRNIILEALRTVFIINNSIIVAFAPFSVLREGFIERGVFCAFI